MLGLIARTYRHTGYVLGLKVITTCLPIGSIVVPFVGFIFRIL